MRIWLKRLCCVCIFAYTFVASGISSSVSVSAAGHVHNATCYDTKPHNHIGSNMKRTGCYKGEQVGEAKCSGVYQFVSADIIDTGNGYVSYTTYACDMCGYSYYIQYSMLGEKCTRMAPTYAANCGMSTGSPEYPIVHKCEGDGSTKTGCYTGNGISSYCKETAILLSYSTSGTTQSCDKGHTTSLFTTWQCGKGHKNTRIGCYTCYMQESNWTEPPREGMEGSCGTAITTYEKTCGLIDGAGYYLDGTYTTNIICNKKVNEITAKAKNQTILK